MGADPRAGLQSRRIPADVWNNSNAHRLEVDHLRIIRSRRGVGLVDAMVTLFLLAAAGAVFAAMFPTGFAASRQAHERKVAASIAQRKMEQVRAMGFESLTCPLLQSAGVIDADDTTSPYSFTSVDSIAVRFASGTGELSVEDVSSDIKRVQATVTWEGPPGSADRRVRLTTLLTDKRARQLN